MKFEEEIKLGNFKEHYSIILGNISIANSELERILKEKDVAREDIASLKSQVASLRNEREDLDKKKARDLVETDVKIKELDKKEKSLSERETEVKEFEAITLRSLERSKTILVQEIDNETRQLDALKREKDSLNNSIAILSKQLSDISVSSKELDKEARESKTTLADLLRTIKDKTDEFHGLLKMREKELKEIEKQIENSRAKVLDANRHFADKEKEIVRRERDVLIVSRRLKELFQEVKPGIALKI